MVFVKVIIYTRNLKTPHGEIIVNNIFSIKDLEILTEKKEEAKTSIQQNIIELLSSISISTTRGVMAATFKGTYLHNAVLPVVDPKSLSKPKEA